MKVTKQKIDRLADRAGVKEETAKDALERADGDLLEAVILLEQEGKLGSAKSENGTTWSTSSGVPAVIDIDTDFVILDDGLASEFGASTGEVPGGSVNGSAGGGYAGAGAGPDGSQAAEQGAAAAGPRQEDFVGGPPPGGTYSYGQPNVGAGGAYGQPNPGANGYYGGQNPGGNCGQQTADGYGYQYAGGAGNAGGSQSGVGDGGHGQQYYYDKKTKSYKYRDESTQFEDGAKQFGLALLRILRASVENHLEVWYKGERLFHFPVILFLLLFVPWIFWTSLVTAVIGLMAGWRYRFSGPHLGRKD